MDGATTVEPTQSTVATVGKPFLVLCGVTQVVCLVFFGIFARPTEMSFKDPTLDAQLYNNYMGVTLMLFVGFGYLMTALRWYGLGAVGLTMFVTCLGMQVNIVVQKLFENGFNEYEFDVMTLLHGDFAVATFLISFGGLIGKVNPSQLVVLVILEAITYSANLVFFLGKVLEVKDAGGSIGIHMYGAYFGLAASFVLGKPPVREKETASSTSDLFSFIGTVFLWLYWPSFCAGWLPAGTIEAEVATTNTVLALLGSSVCTFILSAALSGRIFRPVDIQNATLAGGVAIGAVCNLNIQPIGALLIGCAAGIVSTLGNKYVQDFLCEKLGLHDTCGINNLHGMPSILGGICSIFFPLFIKQGNAGPLGDPVYQFLACVGTLFFSIISGCVTGIVMKVLKDDGESFNDKMYWEVADA